MVPIQATSLINKVCGILEQAAVESNIKIYNAFFTGVSCSVFLFLLDLQVHVDIFVVFEPVFSYFNAVTLSKIFASKQGGW